jgi:hypothetical protein
MLRRWNAAAAAPSLGGALTHHRTTPLWHEGAVSALIFARRVAGEIPMPPVGSKRWPPPRARRRAELSPSGSALA